jgi:PAS domain S-box-containing protein
MPGSEEGAGDPRLSPDQARLFAESVLATLREPLLVLDAALRVRLANRAFYRMFRVAPAATLGRPVYELGHRQFDVPALRNLLETILPQNTSFDGFRLALDLADLGRRTLILNARRIYGAARETQMILLAMEDVTERERAREAQARLAAIVDGSDDAILSTDLDGTIRSWNAGAERLYGYTGEDAVGKPIALIVPPERLAEVAAILERIARGERVASFETEGMRKDGARLQVSLTVSPIRDTQGRVVGASAIARDITARRRVEQALRETSEHLANVCAASPAVLYTLRVAADAPAPVPTWISDNVTRMLGYSVAEALDPDWWMRHLHPDDRAAAVARAGALGAEDRVAQEYRFLRKDGTVVWIRDEVRVVRDAGGRPRHLVGAWLDITERRALEEQLLQAQKMESVGRLAGGVAHDFNNLLTVITGAVDLAAAGFGEGDPLLTELQEIRAAAERATSLTRQLLAFSRRQIFQPRVLNLNDVLADMEPMLRRLLGEDIVLTIAAERGLGNARVDPAQLNQVIMNLVVNSRDAMPRGGALTLETANVELDDAYARRHVGVTPGSYVMLAVTDTGTGMDEATRRRVFEPFFTTKEPGRGTGLGLSTVYGIVKQSGGNVWVYSEPGVGTTFKIYLPRVAAPVDAARPAAAAARRGGAETILVVEDQPELRAVTQRMLARAGYRVLAAGTAEEALGVAERQRGPIHLLVTDVVMPAMRGPELAARLAALHPETRVLYVSGYAENAIVHQGVLDEGTEFLSKPYDAATLTERVRQVLDRPG